MSEPLLHVRALSVDLADGSTAVDGVDFDLLAGQQLALVGESGSGKSLTAAALLGLLPRGARRSAKALRFGALDLSTLGDAAQRALRGRDIALVPQLGSAALNPVRRIGDQLVDVLLRVRGLAPAAARTRCAGLLEGLSLSDPDALLRRYPHELSGGQTQRVMLALALACEPKLLIADEPTSALDPLLQLQVLRGLRRLATDAGSALLLISHDLGLVASASERLAVMYAGRIVEYGGTAAILRAPAHPYTEALLSCRPGPQDSGRHLNAIPGNPPTPQARPGGCAFHPRCGLKLARCADREPVLDVLRGRALRCHLAGLPN